MIYYCLKYLFIVSLIMLPSFENNCNNTQFWQDIIDESEWYDKWYASFEVEFIEYSRDGQTLWWSERYNGDSIQLIPEVNIYPVGTSIINFTLVNNRDDRIEYYVIHWFLIKKIDGQWHRVLSDSGRVQDTILWEDSYNNPYLGTMIGHSQRNMVYDVELQHGVLEEGEYAVVTVIRGNTIWGRFTICNVNYEIDIEDTRGDPILYTLDAESFGWGISFRSFRESAELAEWPRTQKIYTVGGYKTTSIPSIVNGAIDGFDGLVFRNLETEETWVVTVWNDGLVRRLPVEPTTWIPDRNPPHWVLEEERFE